MKKSMANLSRNRSHQGSSESIPTDTGTKANFGARSQWHTEIRFFCRGRHGTKDRAPRQRHLQLALCASRLILVKLPTSPWPGPEVHLTPQPSRNKTPFHVEPPPCPVQRMFNIRFHTGYRSGRRSVRSDRRELCACQGRVKADIKRDDSFVPSWNNPARNPRNTANRESLRDFVQREGFIGETQRIARARTSASPLDLPFVDSPGVFIAFCRPRRSNVRERFYLTE